MEEIEFEVNIKRRVYLVSIAGNVMDALRKKAKSQGLSTETLVNPELLTYPSRKPWNPAP